MRGVVVDEEDDNWWKEIQMREEGMNMCPQIVDQTLLSVSLSSKFLSFSLSQERKQNLHTVW